MLEIQNVSKTFNAGTVNEKTALNGLNLKLNEGDFVTVIGGNGAGKSTMLNAVAGVWPVDCGKIIIDGVDVTRLSEHQRAAYIGRVFQDPMTGTAATMQIEENLALAARRGKPRTLRIGITRAEREQYRELLKSLDLGLEIAGQEVVFEQDAVFEGLVPALDLTLGLRVHRGTADMGHLVGLDIFGQFACDVARTIVAE